eukprot:3765582-Karenia_brevis.AAC.1
MEESPQPVNLPSPLAGSTTLPWLLGQLARGQSSFLMRHHRWVGESGVKKTLPAVYEHEALSTVLDYAIFHDRLNIENLISMEVAARRLQLHENAISESPEAPSYEGAQHFMGLAEKKGGAL